MPGYCGAPTPPRIEHVDDLSRLPVAEQISRVRPLLRTAGLARVDTVLRHHEDNVPGALAELAAKWSEDPRLAGRQVGFGEYVAARLTARLKEIDAEQRPECYDSHRRYMASAAPERLEVDPPDEGAWDAEAPFGRALRALSTGSQIGPLRLLQGVADGTVSNGRQAARAFGYSSKESRARPATQALLCAQEVVSDLSDAERAQLLRSPEAFSLHVRPEAGRDAA